MTLTDFFMGAFLLAVGGLLAFAVLYLVYSALYFLVRVIFYEFSFGPLKSDSGKVLDMKYTPPRTTVSRHATTTSPEKNEVFFRTDIKETTVDSDLLYQRVRVGETIKVRYQNRFRKPRFWSGHWVLDGYRLVSITSRLKETVDFNEEKPSLRSHS